uniref:Uncharacterized protein n=1 Tax=Parascaris equorum TaxID=6256 RepID=A0A914SAI0_PAREQ
MTQVLEFTSSRCSFAFRIRRRPIALSQIQLRKFFGNHARSRMESRKIRGQIREFMTAELLCIQSYE